LVSKFRPKTILCLQNLVLFFPHVLRLVLDISQGGLFTLRECFKLHLIKPQKVPALHKEL